ncbi:MAG: hypothetical protein LBC97_13275 [Bifidobacteriaceae bacterium]|nr:hypothetical protein [Bifidobacteriaceae bacterium]
MAEFPRARSDMPAPVELPFTPYFDAAEALRAAAKSAVEAELAESWKEHGEFIASCMKQAGFTYYPGDAYTPAPEEPGGVYPDNTLPIPWLPDTAEKAERVGYGVASPAEINPAPAFGSGGADPNIEYEESLSESARREYYMALRGWYDYPPTEINPDNCQERSAAEFPEPRGYNVPSEETLLAMQRVFVVVLDQDGNADPSANPDSIAAQPEIIPINDDYRACILDSEISQALTSSSTFVTHVEPRDVFLLAVATASDGSLYRPGEAAEVLFDEIPAEHKSLVGSQAERDIAVADFKCRAATDYVARYAAGVVAVERRYLTEHREEIEKMAAAVEQLDPSLLPD